MKGSSAVRNEGKLEKDRRGQKGRLRCIGSGQGVSELTEDAIRMGRIVDMMMKSCYENGATKKKRKEKM
jgi:hypothetical protein